MGRWGGQREGQRRTAGDAAGAESGTSSANRCAVNVGTIRGRPPARHPVWDRAGPSPTDGRGWDGGPVVVVGVTPHRGGRESRPQGQGGQQVRSKERECQEAVAGEHRRTRTRAVSPRSTGTEDPGH